MTQRNSPSHNLEYDELNNPIGSNTWVLHSLTNELAVHNTIKTVDGDMDYEMAFESTLSQLCYWIVSQPYFIANSVGIWV